MTLQAKGFRSNPLGLYLHVPFCATTCDFCAFYQNAPSRPEIETYLSTMEAAFRWRPPAGLVDTVFWGGGTPGLLTASDLEHLGRTMLSALSKPPREWSIEMAPSTIKKDKIRLLRDLGVTRLSIGVQSFNDRLLERLGRQHSRKQVHRAIETVQANGFENFNLDLIFALPGQSFAQWEQDLDEALTFQPQHLSTYCLTFEEDTKLWSRLQRGDVHRRSEEEEAVFYEKTWEKLEAAGLTQYETSNYARPGYECAHNLHTWQMHDWLGFGPSASSQYEGKRFTELSSIADWTKSVHQREPAYAEVIELNDQILASDALIFGLRMNAGVCPAELEDRFPGGHWQLFRKLMEDLNVEGLISALAGRWILTPRGRLVADAIGTAILESTPREFR